MVEENMVFEWDENKNLLNIKKHRFGFDLASAVFEDSSLLTELDSRDKYFEERWRTIGLVQGILLTVIHTVGNYYGEEIIRIISARKADKKEARRYCFYR